MRVSGGERFPLNREGHVHLYSLYIGCDEGAVTSDIGKSREW